MTSPISAASIRQVLLQHDPLSAWPAAGPNSDQYRSVAELAAGGLGHMLGLGHAWTVVADAIDRQHPGFYDHLREGDQEAGRRMGLVAREIWDRHGINFGRRPSIRPTEAGPVLQPPPTGVMLTQPEVLEGWLRGVESRLEEEGARPAAERESAALLSSVLILLVDAYVDASDAERESTRSAFSRFRRCCYQLSAFAGSQLAALEGPDPVSALRRALLAESLLDLQLDWRDELLLVQDLKRRAETLHLPYTELLALAAACSSPRTAGFLREA